jgi:hypothetical protein
MHVFHQRPFSVTVLCLQDEPLMTGLLPVCSVWSMAYNAAHVLTDKPVEGRAAHAQRYALS